jgi:hypothetical protein
VSAPPLVPIWQRPATWNRRLPREWQRPEAITGAARKQPSRILRAFKFAGGILIALVLFYEINLIFTPGAWTALLGR